MILTYPNTIEDAVLSTGNANTSDNTSINRGWTHKENVALELALIYWGCGRWKTIDRARILPGKRTTQVCLHTQRLLLQQALKPYSQLHLDFDEIRAWNRKRMSTKEVPTKNGLSYNVRGPAGLAMDREYVEDNFQIEVTDRGVDVKKLFTCKDESILANRIAKDQLLYRLHQLGYFTLGKLTHPTRKTAFAKDKAKLLERFFRVRDARKIIRDQESEQHLQTNLDTLEKYEKNLDELMHVFMENYSEKKGMDMLKHVNVVPIFQSYRIDITKHGKKRRWKKYKQKRKGIKRRKGRRGKIVDDPDEFDWEELYEDDKVAEFREPVALRPRRESKSKVDDEVKEYFMQDEEESEEDDRDDKKKDGDFSLD